MLLRVVTSLCERHVFAVAVDLETLQQVSKRCLDERDVFSGALSQLPVQTHVELLQTRVVLVHARVETLKMDSHWDTQQHGVILWCGKLFASCSEFRAVALSRKTAPQNRSSLQRCKNF